MTDTLQTLRNKIDKCDTELLNILQQRFDIVHQVGKLKETSYHLGRPIRETDLLLKWRALAPSLPFDTLYALARILITESLRLEIDDFIVHADHRLAPLATQHYGIAKPILHQTPASLFASAFDKAPNPNAVYVVPSDDSAYWQAEYQQLMGKQLHIIEALPYHKTEKEAFVFANLKEEFIPKNQLFIAPPTAQLPAPQQAELKLSNQYCQLYHLPTEIDNRANLAIRYIGGYSNQIENNLINL